MSNAMEISQTRPNFYPALERLAWLARLPWAPVLILMVVVFVSIFAPLLTSHNPTAVDLPNRLIPPSWQAGGRPEFILGTDTLGRDLMTRIFYGGRVSLQVAFYVLATSGTIGLALGIVAGYLKGIVSSAIMRAVDSLMAMPTLLVALVFAVSLGPSMKTVVLAIAVTIWSRFTRVLRGEVLSISKRDFVAQARVAGCSELRIMAVHILPNIFNTFMILLSLNVGSTIITEASLSFLGAGIPPPTPSWGQMISEGRDYITSAWWLSLLPGFALALTVLAFNQLGDWMRDMLDPRLRQL
jgi:peptide/nickel transport system permease protein